MSCSACSSHVEKAVNKLDAVEKASVNLLTETMDVTYDESRLSSEGIIDAVVKAGYGASVMGESSNGNAAGGQSASGSGNRRSGSAADGKQELQQKLDADARAMKWRLGISIGFLIPLMYVSMHHMFKEWFGIPVPAFIVNTMHGNANAMNFALTQFLLLLPILYVNRKFFSVGFKTLAHRSPNMDSLIAMGSGAALVYGIFAMYRISYGLGYGDMAVVEHYSHDLYFESSGTILTLITVGKYLESRSKGKTSEAITKLMNLAPKVAILVTEDGQEKEVPTESLQKGDVFLVKPGSLVPVDGIVLEGNSIVDEAAITGESVPVEKQAGDHVVSATVNKAGFLKCRADRVGDDTTLAQIIRLVEEASASKAPIAQLADKVAGVFVPTVMAISLVTLIVWLASGATAEFAISTAIAVLVISCPCALGLATPVAIMVGTGVGASNGILIKTGEALQQAKEIDTVVLDKTGTITSGEPRVTDLVPAEGVSESELLSMAYALEKKSEHPLAKAVLLKGEEMGLSAADVTDFAALPGNGLSAKLNGNTIYGGNMKFIGTHVAVPEDMKKKSEALAESGKTPLFFAENEKLVGIIAVADMIKEDSPQAIRELQNMGIHVVMLTGDNERTAKTVGKEAGVDEVIAGVLPDGKESVIRKLKEKGKVAMVGDGINDAPALTRADMGIAIGAGTDVAIDAADVVLMKSRLSDVPAAIRLSRATLTNIHENLFWAFFYNVIGIPLAMGLWIPVFGWKLNPMFGAAAMSLSSFCVVSNALRLNFFDIRRSDRDKKIKTKIHNNKEKESNMMEKTLKVEGMMCPHCEATVKKALEAIDGVSVAEADHVKGTATVTLTKDVPTEVLKKAIEDKDYKVIG